jgi:hypothetical protein
MPNVNVLGIELTESTSMRVTVASFLEVNNHLGAAAVATLIAGQQV